MYLLKNILALAVIIAGVNCRYIYREDYIHPRYVLEEANIIDDNYEDKMAEHTFESVQPRYVRELDNIETDFNQAEFQYQPNLRRIARQAHGKVDMHLPSGTIDVSAGVPLAKSDKNILSAVGSVQGIKPGEFQSAGAGLHLDNVNGHGFTVMGSHVPNLGNQLTAAGKVNLMHTPNHNLDANAFAARTFSNQPHLPDFNAYGGSLDYMYKGKIGANVGATHFPSFDRTDLSAMGKVNIFKTPSSSLDFGTGIQNIRTPSFSHTEPRFDLTWSRAW